MHWTLRIVSFSLGSKLNDPPSNVSAPTAQRFELCFLSSCRFSGSLYLAFLLSFAFDLLRAQLVGFKVGRGEGQKTATKTTRETGEGGGKRRLLRLHGSTNQQGGYENHTKAKTSKLTVLSYSSLLG